IAPTLIDVASMPMEPPPSTSGSDGLTAQQLKTRERNRLAAAKSRRIRKERQDDIKTRLSYESNRNEVLIREHNDLCDEVHRLKELLLKHSGCECHGTSFVSLAWHVLIMRSSRA